MFPKQCVRWFAIIAFATIALLGIADAARADSWSRPNDCGCGSPLPATTWSVPQTNTYQTRPFWMRPTPTYNSSWKQVPVTNYQTQVTNDPLSGVAVTTIEPCNTYESQLRRTASCSLWQRFVKWWKSRCCCIGRPSVSPATTNCPPPSQWVISSTEPTASPYYAPATNGRLVPVPSTVPPTSPVPADRRPQLDPLPQRPGAEGSASPLLPPDREVFVRTLDASASSLELGPPLVAPRSRNIEPEVANDLEHARPSLDANANDRTAASAETSGELVPVSWSIPMPRDEHKLPTDEVWDDTGWKSAH